MTLQEWQALMDLFNRIPLTLAERLWIQALIQREMAKLAPSESNKEE